MKSRLGAGKSLGDIDWRKWSDELQSDLVVKAGLDLYTAGITALGRTREAESEFKESDYAD